MDKMNKIISAMVIGLTLTACGGGSGDDDDDSGGGSGTAPATGSHRVLAFNDLGMHCADLDYSTFVILPPFNVLHTQVIERGAEPRILNPTEVDLSYKAQMDAAGSINKTSQNQPGGIYKTNFWDYVFTLFNDDPQPDEGLAFRQRMPGILNPYTANDPQGFNDFDPDKNWFAADGIPILPIDDTGRLNAYPLMRVSANDKTSGEALAHVDVVLPVASEADCQNCHELGGVGADDTRYPTVEFEIPDNSDGNTVLQAAKANILKLHDFKHGTDLDNQRPVLCASCHYSAALDLEGTGPNTIQARYPMMSQVMHGHHGQLTDSSGNDLFPADGTLEETCYQCHPGKTTKCLRGAMGGAGIVCQDCHGSMLAVGSENREPWVDEPRCESCHTGDALDHLGNSIRLTETYDDDIDTATPRLADNKRFAENSGTLYRNSLGHEGVACEGCHGSTHAIWPNADKEANDNLAAEQLQGHSGTISECNTCHTSLPLTLNGPHGMHNVNSSGWNLGHEDFYERNPNACRACHGRNLEGTVLSRTAADRVLLRDDDGDETIFLAKGTEVSCTLCHGSP